jgi:hypothetical protein
MKLFFVNVTSRREPDISKRLCKGAWECYIDEKAEISKCL